MITQFQKKVYNTLNLIPRGKVTTYKLLWRFIECNSAQAIGQALTRNPDAPTVPCHRVIKTDGTIGGYAFGIDVKRQILVSEGVMFDVNNHIVDSSLIWDFEENS